MQRALPSTILFLAIAFFVSMVSLRFAPFIVHADNECPPGTEHATANDVILMAKAGIQGAEVGMCWKRDDPMVGADIGRAKQDLDGMWCGGQPGRCGPYVSTTQELDPKFATCASKFLQAVRARDPSICIASAFRDTDHQACVCKSATGPCAVPGKSKHQKGTAIDIEKPGQKTLPSWVHEMAQQATGISFPIAGDDGHMQPADGDTNCTTPGFTAPDSGARVATPGGDISSAIKNALGMNAAAPPAQPPAPPTQSSAPTAPAAPAPLPTPQPTPTAAPSPTPISPVNITSPAPSPTPISILPNASDGSSKGTSTRPSAFDLIDQYVNPTSSSVVIGSAVAIDLTEAVTATSSRALLNPLEATGTYISGDLAYQNREMTQGQTFTGGSIAYPPRAPATSSALANTLQYMKDALLQLLRYLVPFQGYNNTRTIE